MNARPDTSGLYVNKAELLARLGLGEKAFNRVLPAFDRQGFPKRDGLTGKWFWPEVEAFLFRRHGVSAKMPASTTTEEEEDWDV